MSPGGEPYTRNIVAFTSALRDNSVEVSSDSLLAATRALGEIDPLDEEQFYHTLRCTLVKDPGDFPTFDSVFQKFWADRSAFRPEDDGSPIGGSTDELVDEPTEAPAGGSRPDDVSSRGTDGDRSGEGPPRRGSDEDSPSSRDDSSSRRAIEMGREVSSESSGLQVDETLWSETEFRVMVSELGKQLGSVPGFEPVASPRGSLDIRRAMSRIGPTSPDRFPRLQPKETETSTLLLIDVSRSMIRNMDREFLFQFLFECVNQYWQTRIFFFDTSATEVTDYFRTSDVEEALRAMNRARTEWGAGTTIGPCLESILAGNPFLIDDATNVLIISDGWDAGRQERLRSALDQIRRTARTTIWLNPLAKSLQYEPKVEGMAVALEYVDYFFGFDSPGDIEVMIRSIRSHDSNIAGREISFSG